MQASGFTPGEQRERLRSTARVVQENVTVLPDGEVDGGVPAPYQASGERPFTLTVTEVDQPSNTASASSRVTALALRLKPRKADAVAAACASSAAASSTATEVFAHYVRKGKLRKTVSPRRPAGPVRPGLRQAPPDPDRAARARALDAAGRQPGRPTAPSPRASSCGSTITVTRARCAAAAR